MRDRERYEKRVGTVVDGRWRVDSLLGWGSTSAVYAATHRNGHRAALKILHQSLCADPKVVERFLREAGIANAIKHRAIVPIRDDGTTEEGCAYLVLELLEGDTLDALRDQKTGRIDLEKLAPIADELMSAISAVHTAGIIHRDLKPQNIFVTKSNELKLLDFGTARIFDGAAGASSVSVVGMVVGTPAFMSPEQARGSRAEVDAQSDVWSLGAMLFTLLSGQYVHVGRDAHARLLVAASKPARKLGDVAPSVDDRIATVVDRALEYAKDDRWPDVASMRAAFRRGLVSAVPTMRDLAVFAGVGEEEEEASVESVAGSVSVSDPVVAAAPAIDEPAALTTPEIPSARSSESEILGVSSTQNVRRVKTGIPMPALVAGIGAMAAVLFLVAFFVAGGDEPTVRAPAAPPAELFLSPPAEPAPVVTAPASGFIVIEAQNVPPVPPVPPVVEVEKKKPLPLPAWATAPMPKPKASLAKPAVVEPTSSVSAEAGTASVEGTAAEITDPPAPTEIDGT